MKRIVALLLAFVCVFGFVACKDKGKEVAMGKVSGNKYESEFIGIGFNLPSGWTFYSEEQIRELNNATADMLDDKYTEQIKKADIIYDMMAVNSKTGYNVGINLEKASALGAAVTSEKTYVKNGMADVKSALESAGASNVTTTQTKVTIAGESLHAIEVTCKMQGVAIYEVVACKKVGNYYASIAITTTGSNQTDRIISQFYAFGK